MQEIAGEMVPKKKRHAFSFTTSHMSNQIHVNSVHLLQISRHGHLYSEIAWHHLLYL